MGDEHLLPAIGGAVLAAFGMTQAAEAPPGAPGTLTYTLENDWFGGQDRNYTNGFRYAYVTGPLEPSRLESRLVRDPRRETTFRRSFALAQTIHTPDNIFTVHAQPDDHPYSGYLYGEYAAMAEKDGAWEIVTIEVGVVGPWALGEEVQSLYHDATGREVPMGWSHQHPNELVANVSYDRKMKPLLKARVALLGFDLTPSYGATVGTVKVNAQAGAMLRIGNRLGSDFGPARIRPSLTGSGHFSDAQPFGWYVFAGAQARAVGHDLTLDGSLFRDDVPSADKRFLVGDIQYGAALQLGPIQLGWTSVRRSERFVGQGGPDRFGAISVSLKL